ncbi:MAG: hypothetical protein NZM18_11550 [Thermoflexales bacterium]|nr:hypothetical protein [Thermoflexales bacterium]
MKKIALFTALITALVCVSVVAAQVSYPQPFFTSYQLVNLGSSPATITVNYYSMANGLIVPGASKNFPNVAPGASVTVLQAVDDPNLGSGKFSAVVSSSQPVAAIVNQQLGQAGSTAATPPFSSYTAATSGATSVTLPVVMYNWFGYYTDVFIQNVGSGPANVNITYSPTSIGACTTGASGQSDTVSNLAQFASTTVSQVSKTSLGAPSVPNCGLYTGRFLGGATVTSNQPIVVVVNQNYQGKLFTYNGFTQGGTTLLAPAYMRNFYGFYASITIANLGTQDANVSLTYKSDGLLSSPANQTINATRVVPAGKSITIYDGPNATDVQSDLDTVYDLPSERFLGSIRIDSTNGQPIVAMVNQESIPAAGGKAGAYNAMLTSEAATKISAPLIQSAFYGYYTSLTIQTVDGTDAQLKICYTSDGVYSSVTNQTKCYNHTTTNGFLNRYEGPSATAVQSDLLDDPVWLSGGHRRFLGSATVEVVSGPKIVAFVNSESNNTSADAQYTYNTLIITP